MKRAYTFVAGNSRITPLGIAAAAGAALALRHVLGAWAPAVFLGILLATLAASTCETVQ